MGAFLLVHKKNSKDEDFLKKFPASIEIFTTKIKLNFSVTYDLGNYNLYLFSKRFYSAKNFLAYQNGDFIAATGSLFYKGESGLSGLNSLYYDYQSGIKIENHCRGHYCVILKVGEETFIFRDFFGLYPVYHSTDFSIISSSFLANAMLIPAVSISKIELFEYLLNGFWYSNQTLFTEIKLLEEGGMLNINTKARRGFNPEHVSVSKLSCDNLISAISSNLISHFSTLINAFGKVRFGLSGGYDSRLMLASLLHIGIIPELYVNGTPGSTDIKCAKDIAEGLGISIKEIHFYEEYETASERTEEFFMNRFYHFDGLGTSGIFDNYSDLEYILENPFHEVALLNGAGGEIFREAWNIPNRNIKLETFVKSRYDKPELRDILRGYSRQEYFENLINKIKKTSGIRFSDISRTQVELLHINRYKAIHFILSTHQQLCPFILPFYEPDLIFQSLEVPVKLKYNARLNKDLMKKIYPQVASYKSAYGYSFTEPVPIKFRTKEYIQTNIPLKLRPLMKSFIKSKKLPVNKFGNDLLNKEIVIKILPQKDRHIDNYIDTDKIISRNILSRSLTVEFLLQQLQANK